MVFPGAMSYAPTGNPGNHAACPLIRAIGQRGAGQSVTLISMKWSVLDQFPTSRGSPQDKAIRDSIALAQHCDELGYERFWVSEHHNSGSIVGTAPEILMAAVAATTRRIRVGSAGIMLPHYSALKVAEQFRVLEAIAPGRIDLGVGRAPGSDGLTARALNPYSNAAEDFPRQVQELQYWVSGIPAAAGASPSQHHGVAEQQHQFRNCGFWAAPDTGRSWRRILDCLMPTLISSAMVPVPRRRSRCTGEIIAPSERYPKPCVTICVWALAADTEREAQHQATSREYWRAGFEKGLRMPLVSPQVAEAHSLYGRPNRP